MKPTWKKRALQTGVLAMMTTIAFGAVSASAADTTTTEAKPGQAIQIVKAAGAAPALHFSSSSAGLLNQPAHERNYLKLLATTYTPDSLADWKKALDERKQVEAEMPKPSFAKTISISKEDVKGAVSLSPSSDAIFTTTFVDGEAFEGGATLKALPALPALPTLTDEELKNLPEGVVAGKNIFVTRSALGDGTTPPQVTRILPVEAGVASDIMIAAPVESESMKLQQKLTEAVEADNAEAIRAILPDLLKDFVKETENLREMAAKIKEQQSKIEAEAEKK